MVYPAGNTNWMVVKAVGQFVRSYLGALTDIGFGASLIRPQLVVVLIAMARRVLLSP